jgi:hypothetical protein
MVGACEAWSERGGDLADAIDAEGAVAKEGAKAQQPWLSPASTRFFEPSSVTASLTYETQEQGRDGRAEARTTPSSAIARGGT